jgi:hypothetical protein
MDKTDTSFIIHIKFDHISPAKLNEIVRMLQADPGIKEVGWSKS